MVRLTKPIVHVEQPVRSVPSLSPLEIVQRKSDVLKSSSLSCLGRSYDATINLTRGCPHRCIYCYARGYRNYPGDDRVLLYANTVEKLREELLHKRRLPRTVYFSSSSDAFGPYRLLQRMTYEAMQLLLERGIHVSFLTKGYIWRRFYYLWRQYPGMVNAQIGLNTLNPKIASWLEPLAATPRRRLRNIKRLLATGIDVTVRIDPLVPYVTDTPEQMTDLCRLLAGMGVKNLATAYLFVRPRILRNILDDLPAPTLRRRMWEVYHAGATVPLHGSGCAIRLPAKMYRMAGYDRLRRISSRFGLQLRLCSCKNPDLNLPDQCNLIAPAASLAKTTSPAPQQQLQLFEM
jgi:DNA repair photolyase